MPKLPEGFEVVSEKGISPAPALPEGFEVVEPEERKFKNPIKGIENDAPLASFAVGGGEGLLLNGLSDVLAAGDAARAKLFEGDDRDFTTIFSEKNKERIAEIKAYEEANPNAFLAGELTGAVASVGAPGGAAVKGGTMTAKAAKSALAGTTAGGMSGFNEGADLEERIDKGALGALAGGVVGAALPATGRQIGKVFHAVFGKKAAVPTSQALATRSKALYRAAEKTGTRIRPEATIRLVQSLNAKAQSEGAAKGLTDPVMTAIKNISERQGTEMSVKEVETLRKMLINAAGSNNPSNNRIAGQLIDAFDEWASRLDGRDVMSNLQHTGKAFKTLKGARKLWRQKIKAEIIEEAFEKARNATGANYTAAGFETALRQKFRAIADNKRVFKKFSKQEQKAILDVVRGNKGRNLARLIGKFAPTGTIPSFAAIGAGIAASNPLVAAGVAGAGSLGRTASTKMGLKAANKAKDQILRGKPLPDPSTELSENIVTGGGLTLIP